MNAIKCNLAFDKKNIFSFWRKKPELFEKFNQIEQLVWLTIAFGRHNN